MNHKAKIRTLRALTGLMGLTLGQAMTAFRLACVRNEAYAPSTMIEGTNGALISLGNIRAMYAKQIEAIEFAKSLPDCV